MWFMFTIENHIEIVNTTKKRKDDINVSRVILFLRTGETHLKKVPV